MRNGSELWGCERFGLLIFNPHEVRGCDEYEQAHSREKCEAEAGL
jgi:hypothetical protein